MVTGMASVPVRTGIIEMLKLHAGNLASQIHKVSYTLIYPQNL